MLLLEHLHLLKPFRIPVFPDYLRHICIITLAEHLSDLQKLMDEHPGASLDRIVVLDSNNTSAQEHSIRLQGKLVNVPICPLETLVSFPQLDFVYYVPHSDTYNQLFTKIAQILAGVGIKYFYLHHQGEPSKSPHSYHLPDYYNKNANRLEMVYRSLADEASKEVYAAAVKAILTGNQDYFPIAAHESYYHPLVQPEDGDIMIDGGVSDMVGAQEGFAASVGPRGKIFGFEPMSGMCASAKKSLAGFGQYQLLCMGLGAEKGKLYFSDKRDSSHVTDSPDGAVSCDVIDIDSFMAENKIRRLNCIKLDVEGSELAALKGGRESIKKYRPKLIICLYHKAEDLFEIPEYIMRIAPEYELRVAHEGIHFLDTILYAKVPG